jgi:K+-sensing histidine kinase KdpD
MPLHDLHTDSRPDESRASRMRHAVIAAVAAALFLAVVAAADKVTGPHMSMLLFYVVPVIVATIFIGRLAGIIFSFVSAATWLVVALWEQSSGCWVDVWNATMRLAVFLVIAILISLLQRHRGELTKLRDSLPW